MSIRIRAVQPVPRNLNRFVELLVSRKADLNLPPLLTIGQKVTLEESAIQGHGILSEQDEETGEDVFHASLSGVLRTVNSLAYIEPVHSKYKPAAGDVVIGRVTDVGQGRWFLETGARQPAVLQLATISLPSGEQRKKTDAETVDLRRFYSEDDLICTEVQKVNKDGDTSILHTRSARYGKLANGTCAIVPPTLMMRLAQHMHNLSCGVHLILGKNGYVWIGSPPKTTATDTLNFVEFSEDRFQPVNAELRKNIARVRNAVVYLGQNSIQISPQSIQAVYDASIALKIGISDVTDEMHSVDILQHALGC